MTCEACKAREAVYEYDRSHLCARCFSAFQALPSMRRQYELQHAHDLVLEALEDSRVRAELVRTGTLERLLYVGLTLCWVLGHEGGHVTGMDLEELLQIIQEDLGSPIEPAFELVN